MTGTVSGKPLRVIASTKDSTLGLWVETRFQRYLQDRAASEHFAEGTKLEIIAISSV
jgi:hypothetical protein